MLIKPFFHPLIGLIPYYPDWQSLFNCFQRIMRCHVYCGLIEVYGKQGSIGCKVFTTKNVLIII